MLVEMRYACASTGTICASFACSGMPSMFRSHVCIDLSFDPYGRLIEIGLSAGCKFFTGVPGRDNSPLILHLL